jgi:3-deoxy-7-phosphoheptulonate synthase
MQDWSPSSWRRRPARQLPVYRDAGALEASERRLENLPPLIFPGETDQLRARLAAV